MRIIIDMQGAQAENKKRGIGRYVLSLVSALVKNRGDHEIFLVLNGEFPDSIESIRAVFDDLLPSENIRVWNAVGSMAYIKSENDWRRYSGELSREAFLASLKPDVVLLSSLFEGLVDDAVTSIAKLSHRFPTAVILYDLIPFIHRTPYLDNPVVEAWYLEKIEYLRQADLWLAISESSRQEGVTHLGLPDEWSVSISTDADRHFQKLAVSEEDEYKLRKKYGLSRSFVMYTGGIDHRKNIEGLIRSYAKLPKNLRMSHQLAIICSVQPESRRRLEKLANKQGLSENELILTGFVPEEDLVNLYNLCSLFVFPSLHEGFGLPALEAMRCGAPVIGGNKSSLPEVIGLPEALFDPYSDDDIAQTMERALTNDEFRAKLVEHGKYQAMKFSWDQSARLALVAMERLVKERQDNSLFNIVSEKRLKLAYISPLPPERSGIADYSAELLPELAKYYDIEVVIAQEKVTDAWISANCPIRTVQWFIDNASNYDRVLYHFGNSAFHQHMFDLLSSHPGVVVLHDFYLANVYYHMEMHGYEPGCWSQELYQAHGYVAFHDRFHTKNEVDVVWKYPCSLNVIQSSLGMIAHSVNTLRLAKQWYGDKGDNWSVIPLVRDPKIKKDRELSRKALGLGAEDFVVCAFGILGPTKLNHRLVDAWLNSSLGKDKACHLVFVGENHSGIYGRELLEKIRVNRAEKNIRITGWADTDLFRSYLVAADLGVQLRTLSRGETSAAVLDCMCHGLATIVNANGSMADLDDRAVWRLLDDFSDEDLITALETLWQDRGQRQSLGKQAREIILDAHSPQVCAEKYKDAIEGFYEAAQNGLTGLLSTIAKIPDSAPSNEALIQLSSSLAENFPLQPAQRQLLVDISELVQRDSKSGIQRVVRSILNAWLSNPPLGYRVEPVYATVGNGYQYARRFTAGFLGCPDNYLQDEPIDYAFGDVFFALDLQPLVQTAHREFYQELRRKGIYVKFLVYDLLCIQLPQCFGQGADEMFVRWLEVVAESDGAVCISRAVANDLTEWTQKKGFVRLRPLKIDWFHLGADVDNSFPSKGIPSEAKSILNKLHRHPSFLMVGTLEPRKGHEQILDAFEQLWHSGIDVNLTIVGKQGWLVEKLVKRLRSHNELNERLFWLEGISDEYLESVYAVSTCLVAASYGEGFGLPLIEAAQHKLPIIARDIPVFREVAGSHAFYFNSEEPSVFAESIREWLTLYNEKGHPISDNMPWLTWKESAEQLLNTVIDRDHLD